MSNLSITQLFQNQPPGISTQNPSATPASGSWLATLLADAASLGMPTTAWQSGDPIRTAIAIMATELSKEDGVISQQAQGGFLDFAANGTVTLVGLNGTTATMPVSPDPSVPGQNPNGATTWLDVLSTSRYNCTRLQPSTASNTLYVVNPTGSSLGTFNPGTFHVQNSTTFATYSNQTTFTLSPSSTAGTAITSVTSSSGQYLVTTSSAHGLTTGAVVYITGTVGTGGFSVNGFWAITVQSTTSFTLNGSTFVGSYTSGGTVYIPQALVFAADLVGVVGNASVGAINAFVTAAPGCACSNLATFAGANYESNNALASRCRAKLATLSPNGPQGAYVFYALTAYLILNGQMLPPSPPAVTSAAASYLAAVGALPTNPLPSAITLDGGPITRAVVGIATGSGTVTVTVANSSGPVGGCMNLAVTNATAATPIVIQTSAAHGLVSGDYAQVNQVQGLAGANGVWKVTYIDATHFSLNGSVGTGSYTSGTGQVSGGDLYAVNSVIAAYCTPNAVTELVQSASGVSLTIASTVYVPKAFVGTYTTAMQTALTAYASSFPIGGYTVDGQPNTLSIDVIDGILYAAGQNNGAYYVQGISGTTLNGQSSDLNVGATGVINALTINVNVVGV
jgi:hypothetical protein